MEIDKTIGSFNLENEIKKIKIPIPLVELAKNPIYRKQIAKMISFSENESQADVINLEDDSKIPGFVIPKCTNTLSSRSPISR